MLDNGIEPPPHSGAPGLDVFFGERISVAHTQQMIALPWYSRENDPDIRGMMVDRHTGSD